jgi:hypothetical protein
MQFHRIFVSDLGLRRRDTEREHRSANVTGNHLSRQPRTVSTTLENWSVATLEK